MGISLGPKCQPERGPGALDPGFRTAPDKLSIHRAHETHRAPGRSTDGEGKSVLGSS
jgi:hypothetical protein